MSSGKSSRKCSKIKENGGGLQHLFASTGPLCWVRTDAVVHVHSQVGSVPRSRTAGRGVGEVRVEWIWGRVTRGP